MKLFIIHHNICLLKKSCSKPFIAKINLCKIKNDKCSDYYFGINKFIYHLNNKEELLNDEIIGIVDAKYNAKFHKVCRLEYLNAINYDKEFIYSPDLSSSWYEKSIEKMPICKDFMDDVISHNNFEKNKQSIFSNNFICHKNILKTFCSWYVKNFDIFYEKYQNLVFQNPKKDKEFFYERLTAIYFANIHIKQSTLTETSKLFMI